MIPSSLVRLVVVGLTSFGVVFQALLLSLHLSLIAAPKTDITSLALSVLCSGHESIDPAQDVPADNPSTCSLCLFCSKSSGKPYRFSRGVLASNNLALCSEFISRLAMIE